MSDGWAMDAFLESLGQKPEIVEGGMYDGSLVLSVDSLALIALWTEEGAFVTSPTAALTYAEAIAEIRRLADSMERKLKATQS